MPDPQNIESQTQLAPTPDAAPENTSVSAPVEAENQAATPMEILPAEAPAATPSEPTPVSPAPDLEFSPASSQTPSSEPAASPIKNLLLRAKEKIQFRKRVKLEKIMDMVKSKAAANAAANAGQAEQEKITNDNVQKLLHCSDATAARYLRELVKQGRLKMISSRGGAFYELPCKQKTLHPRRRVFFKRY